jgi:hypothetical protein
MTAHTPLLAATFAFCMSMGARFDSLDFVREIQCYIPWMDKLRDKLTSLPEPEYREAVKVSSLSGHYFP